MQTVTTSPLRTGAKKTIVFENRSHWVENLLVENSECLTSALSIIGKPLIVYNVEKLIAENQSIDHILLPHNFSHTADLLQTSFPQMQIDEYEDETRLANLPECLILSLNSAVVRSQSTDYVIKPIVYPWDVLKIMLEILENEVQETSISKDSSIADLTVIKGPCMIDDGVCIDDFNKIIGPVYIGKNSKIGTGNLIRNCTIGSKSSIGFGCEIARTVMMGSTKISHHDIILDSIVGHNTWMGAFVGTTNLLLNNETVKYKLGDVLVSTGLEHFGSVMGCNSAIGAGTIILPGRHIPPNSILQAGTIFSK